MFFKETSSSFHNSAPTKTQKNTLKLSQITEPLHHFDQETTIDIATKQNHDCKYCNIKQKLVEGANNKCLIHSMRSISGEINQHLSDYLPTSKKLREGPHHRHQTQTQDISINKISNQAKELHENIKKIQVHTNTSICPGYNQIVSILNQCIGQLKKKQIKFEDKENNTSYTISLQLDVSNDMTQWLKFPADESFIHLEQQGLKSQINILMNSLQQCNPKGSLQLFIKLMHSIEQKLQLNHIMLKQYQTNMNEMNKKLLTYMQKASANNGFKEVQQDLNFIQHISSLGEITSRNFSNSSSIMLKRKSFDDHQNQSDLLRFVLLQASAIERIIPEISDRSMFD